MKLSAGRRGTPLRKGISILMKRYWLWPSVVLLAVPLLGQSTATPVQPAAPAPSPAPSGGPTPSFPSQVEVVNVDVAVMDKKGNPILGLSRDDFTLLDDGQSQSISSFEAITTADVPPGPVVAAGAAAPAPLVRRVSTNVGASKLNSKTFSIVFDDIHLTNAQAHRAKIAISQFLKNGTRDGDIVTLAATGGGAWWNARIPEGREELITLLKRLDGRLIPEIGNDRVSEYEAMRIELFNDQNVTSQVERRFETYGASMNQSGGSTDSGLGLSGDPLVKARSQEVYFQSVSRNRITLELLNRILGSLAGSRGRKSLVLVSQGFIYDPSLTEFKDVVEAARRANVAIYFLDTRGLGGFPIEMGAEFGPPLEEQDIGNALTEHLEEAGGAESVSVDSGGFVVSNNNDLLGGIQRIANESRNYYLLGFNPSNSKRDGKFRKLEVKVNNRKGLQIRARKGYYAPSDAVAKVPKKAPTSDPAIQKALDSPFDSEVIPLRMSSYVFDETLMGKASAVVTTEVNIDGFAFEEKDVTIPAVDPKTASPNPNGTPASAAPERKEKRFVDTLEFLLVVAHRDTGEFFRYDQKVDMKLLPETRAKAKSVWFPIARDFELAAGAYEAKIVVRDVQSGRIGTVLHSFEVAPLGDFRTSTPIVSDTLLPLAEGSKIPKPQILAHRSFPQGAMLYCQFDVFGAAKDKASGMPKVVSGYAIRAKDGAELTHVDPSPITPTSLGKLSRLTGSSLKAATPGEYELVVSLKDELGGKSIELVEPFTVTAAPAAD
jgi:VWFA-related protein